MQQDSSIQWNPNGRQFANDGFYRGIIKEALFSLFWGGGGGCGLDFWSCFWVLGVIFFYCQGRSHAISPAQFLILSQENNDIGGQRPLYRGPLSAGTPTSAASETQDS